jgi:beta-phosphoglucomutase
MRSRDKKIQLAGARLAIFDLDGTLFDTNPVNFSAYRHALQLFGYDLSEERFQRSIGRHWREFVLEWVPAEDLNLAEKVHQEKVQAYKDYLHLARENKHLFSIMKGMHESYYISLVTGASKKNCNDLLAYFEKSDCFDLIVTQEDVAQQKPSPEGFVKCMRHFGVDSQQTIVFEDAESGIRAAKQVNAVVFKVERF